MPKAKGTLSGKSTPTFTWMSTPAGAWVLGACVCLRIQKSGWGRPLPWVSLSRRDGGRISGGRGSCFPLNPGVALVLMESEVQVVTVCVTADSHWPFAAGAHIRWVCDKTGTSCRGVWPLGLCCLWLTLEGGIRKSAKTRDTAGLRFLQEPLCGAQAVSGPVPQPHIGARLSSGQGLTYRRHKGTRVPGLSVRGPRQHPAGGLGPVLAG